MALKDILVHVDNGQACAARLEAATKLADAHGAHLVGLYVKQSPMLPNFTDTMAHPELLLELQELLHNQTQQAEELFNQITDQANLVSEWRYAEGDLVRLLNQHARYADLVIVGQGESNEPRPRTGGIVVNLLFGSGRPVLIIPHTGTHKPVGDRVLVAWNARREAVRAINDALPLLKQASRVNVVAINPPSGDDGEGDIPSADICLHLARHEVKADAQHVQAEDIKVGDLLLKRAAEQDIDLIVMGAYGHSRLREFMLSGATRHLMEHMTVPVFMSH